MMKKNSKFWDNWEFWMPFVIDSLLLYLVLALCGTVLFYFNLDEKNLSMALLYSVIIAFVSLISIFVINIIYLDKGLNKSL